MRGRSTGLMLLLVLAGLSRPGVAADSFTIGGFGTLGAVRNPSEQFGFIRDLTQSDGARDKTSLEPDSILGLQLENTFSEQTRGVLQLVSRHTYTDNYTPRVSWAFLEHDPTPQLDIRAGRLGWDVYMLSDSRNVGYSYLWARPPIEYFGLQQVSHIDGADVVFTRPLGEGLFWTKAYAGVADEKLPLDTGDPYDLGGSTAYGAHVNYQQGDWWFRLGYNEVQLDKEVAAIEPLLAALRTTGDPAQASLASDLSVEGATATHLVAGLIFERGPLQVQAMYDRATSDTLLFPDHHAGYAMLSYRVGSLTPFAYVAEVRSDRARRESGFPPGSPPDVQVRFLLDDTVNRQRSVGAGVRWDFRPDAAFKLQVERIDAEDALSSLTRRPDPDWDGDATLVSATLDFIF